MTEKPETGSNPLDWLDLPYGDAIQHDDNPPVYVLDDVLNEAECSHIIELAGDQLAQALVAGADGPVPSKGRTNRNCWIAHLHDELVNGICRRIADIVHFPLNYAEDMQVVHYGLSQQYRPHFDSHDHATGRGKWAMRRGGQRLLTTLVYLNEVEGGGETVFPKIALRVQPKAGRMVIFHSCKPGSNEVHPLSLHGGSPIEQGEKWAFNLWFHERPFQRDPGPAGKDPPVSSAPN